MKKNGFVASILAVSLLLLAILLAGCGDESADNNGADDASGVVAEQNAEQKEKDAIDACDIVTQQDATKLFDKSAKRDAGESFAVPGMLAECLWSYDTDVSSQLIQFRIWDGEMYYAPTEDSEPFDLGDKASIRVNSFAGVDIEWVQDGRTMTLSYFTTGSDVPDATTKVEEVKAMAKSASEKL